MYSSLFIALLLAASLLTGVACKNQKAANPLAQSTPSSRTKCCMTAPWKR